MAWLVTGGAGYIGAHVVAAMREAGEEVVVIDDLSTGDATRVLGVPLVTGSVLNAELVAQTISRYSVAGIVHVAAKKQVAESVLLPLFYYRENVEGLRVLLQAAVKAQIEHFVFSSSAAVYGEPDVELVHEETDQKPVNPYGSTKLMGERMIQDVAAAHSLRFANLRYFNVAGAADPPLADRGASNLVPMVFEQIHQRRPPRIFGSDYPTPDGTCIRDFIHVADVASAHVVAAAGLTNGSVSSLTANIGRGEGVSVREMVSAIRSVTGTVTEAWADPIQESRRPGDPARVVASADRIYAELGWRANYGIEEIVTSAWAGWLANAGNR